MDELLDSDELKEVRLNLEFREFSNLRSFSRYLYTYQISFLMVHKNMATEKDTENMIALRNSMASQT